MLAKFSKAISLLSKNFPAIKRTTYKLYLIIFLEIIYPRNVSKIFKEDSVLERKFLLECFVREMLEKYSKTISFLSESFPAINRTKDELYSIIFQTPSIFLLAYVVREMLAKYSKAISFAKYER